MWLLATLLDNVDKDYFHHHRKFCWTALLQTILHNYNQLENTPILMRANGQLDEPTIDKAVVEEKNGFT